MVVEVVVTRVVERRWLGRRGCVRGMKMRV